MTLHIRPLEDGDVAAVVALWQACDLTRPWNHPNADIALAREKLGWEPRVPLDEGLAQTVAYFRQVIGTGA